MSLGGEFSPVLASWILCICVLKVRGVPTNLDMKAA